MTPLIHIIDQQALTEFHRRLERFGQVDPNTDPEQFKQYKRVEAEGADSCWYSVDDLNVELDIDGSHTWVKIRMPLELQDDERDLLARHIELSFTLPQWEAFKAFVDATIKERQAGRTG